MRKNTAQFCNLNYLISLSNSRNLKTLLKKKSYSTFLAARDTIEMMTFIMNPIHSRRRKRYFIEECVHIKKKKEKKNPNQSESKAKPDPRKETSRKRRSVSLDAGSLLEKEASTRIFSSMSDRRSPN